MTEQLALLGLAWVNTVGVFVSMANERHWMARACTLAAGLCISRFTLNGG